MHVGKLLFVKGFYNACFFIFYINKKSYSKCKTVIIVKCTYDSFESTKLLTSD